MVSRFLQSDTTSRAVTRHSLHDAAFGRIAAIQLDDKGPKCRFGLAIRWPGGSAHACDHVILEGNNERGNVNDFCAVAKTALQLIERLSPGEMGLTILVAWPDIVHAVALAEAGISSASPALLRLTTSPLWARLKPSFRVPFSAKGNLDDETILSQCAGLLVKAAIKGKSIAIASDDLSWRTYLYTSAHSAAHKKAMAHQAQQTSMVRLAGRMTADEFIASPLHGRSHVPLVSALISLDTAERRMARLASITRKGIEYHIGIASDGRSIDLVPRRRPGPKDAPPMSLVDMRIKARLPAFMATWALAIDDDLEPGQLRGHLTKTGGRIAAIDVPTVDIHSDFSNRDGRRFYGLVATDGHKGIFGRIVDRALRNPASIKSEEEEAKGSFKAFEAALKAFPGIRRFVLHCDNIATVRRFHMAFYQRLDDADLTSSFRSLINLACKRGVMVDMVWQKGHSFGLTDGSFLNHIAHGLAVSENWPVRPIKPSEDWIENCREFILDTHGFQQSDVAAFLGLPVSAMPALIDSNWLAIHADGTVPLSSIMRIMGPLREEMRSRKKDEVNADSEDDEPGIAGSERDFVAQDCVSL